MGKKIFFESEILLFNPDLSFWLFFFNHVQKPIFLAYFMTYSNEICLKMSSMFIWLSKFVQILIIRSSKRNKEDQYFVKMNLKVE